MRKANLDMPPICIISSSLKGPKGQKIVVETKMEDPHVLNDIVDPVFSGDVQLQGIKHR